MMDDLHKAYTAYQQALYHLPNPKEPKLWYGIGILYDRYGSLEHAEEAFASVVHMDPDYEKANEIYFRLGIIYKQQNKFQASLECFRYILHNPPRPLTEVDIWFQIGHVYEQQKEFGLAKEAYERVLAENPSHAKVLQQLGWLYHQSDAGFENQEKAIQFLTSSLESDPNDAQSWYLLGRAYMAGRNYNKAYEAYQQAVYRDGKNPTFWCSIGVLYYQISQYRDALDAYSRAIRLNPYISEVWFDLGSLYESCNNQVSDAIDAYTRAAELDPENPHIQQRLTLLRNAEARGEQVSSVPVPQDVHPTAYANHPATAGQPPHGSGLPSSYGSGPIADSGTVRTLPGHPNSEGRGSRSPPRHGRATPSIPNIDERGTKASSHAQLAPMDTPRRTASPPSHKLFQAQGRTSPHSQALGGSSGQETEKGQADRKSNGKENHDDSRQSHPNHETDNRHQGDERKNGVAEKSVPQNHSPRSDSSSESNRPLAANPPAPLPPKSSASRIVDEDYDGGAADALMGLAGAASASAPITKEDAGDRDTASADEDKKTEDKDLTTPSQQENRDGNMYPASTAASNQSEDARLAEVKERAEAAALAEEQQKQKEESKKRSASVESQGTNKRHRVETDEKTSTDDVEPQAQRSQNPASPSHSTETSDRTTAKTEAQPKAAESNVEENRSRSQERSQENTPEEAHSPPANSGHDGKQTTEGQETLSSTPKASDKPQSRAVSEAEEGEVV